MDDGSTDRSGLMCDHFAAADSRIKVIHKKMVDFQMLGMLQYLLHKGAFYCLSMVMTTLIKHILFDGSQYGQINDLIENCDIFNFGLFWCYL